MKYLGAEADLDSELNYRRDIPAGQSGDYVSLKSQPPNIVLIMLESLGANRLGAYGNPINPTPNLDALIKKSHFFPNFFVPSSGTARTVFGKITGIPDVSFGGTTASRNPLFADQQVVMSSLTDYEKYYFLGGSANWANIRALLRNNLGAELNLFEEGSWQGPNVDVWGISDRTLFTESHEKLLQRDKSKPFIAVIQTAANHRPFTIPDDGSGFEIQEISDSEVNKHGFLGADQFNAVRLLDYNIGYYLNELVAKSDYADNTLFLLYGDHNDSSMPSPHLKQDDDLVLNKHHVPFFIYGPGLLKEGKVFQTPMSLVDMLSTAVWLAGEPYTNTTMGRIIYQVDADSSYVIVHGGDRRNRPTIGLRGKDFYLQMLYNGENVRLHDLHREDVKTDVQEQYPEKAAEMKSLLLALFHTATYMMYHNQKIAD
jgi:phosphoglycerol transferase MdoB-like AlkP superfamily enzyme